MIYAKLSLDYTSGKYIRELEGVRGVAILFVVLYHCFPGSVTSLGWVGVDLFFVLSGFLITGILLDSRNDNRYYVKFVGRRVLRIFPIYYLVLFLILVLIPAFSKIGSNSNFDFYIRHQGWFWLYVQNWLFSFQGFPQNHILVHFWSLGVEEQFYLIWPLVIFWLPERYLLKVSFFLCVIAIVFRSLPLDWFHFASSYRYLNTFSRMDALLIGGIVAQLIRNNRKLLERIAVPVGMSGLGIFIIGVVISRSPKFMLLPHFYTAIDLFMGMIVVLSLSKAIWFRRILRWHLLTFLGKYSYGFYVYHYIIYVLLKYKLGPWMAIHLQGFSPFILMVTLALIVIFLSLIISVLSYHLIEVHFLKLKGYLGNSPRARRDRPLNGFLVDAQN